MRDRYVFEVVVENQYEVETPWPWHASLTIDGEVWQRGFGETEHDALAALVRMHWSEARDLFATLREDGGF